MPVWSLRLVAVSFGASHPGALAAFWAGVLGRPIVWDQGPQIAMQSPRGGTKISWDSWPPCAPKDGRDRQQFNLAASESAAEAERLVGLGATVLGNRDDGVELADPDENKFLIASDR